MCVHRKGLERAKASVGLRPMLVGAMRDVVHAGRCDRCGVHLTWQDALVITDRDRCFTCRYREAMVWLKAPRARR